MRVKERGCTWQSLLWINCWEKNPTHTLHCMYCGGIWYDTHTHTKKCAVRVVDLFLFIFFNVQVNLVEHLIDYRVERWLAAIVGDVGFSDLNLFFRSYCTYSRHSHWMFNEFIKFNLTVGEKWTPTCCGLRICWWFVFPINIFCLTNEHLDFCIYAIYSVLSRVRVVDINSKN